MLPLVSHPPFPLSISLAIAGGGVEPASLRVSQHYYPNVSPGWKPNGASAYEPGGIPLPYPATFDEWFDGIKMYRSLDAAADGDGAMDGDAFI